MNYTAYATELGKLRAYRRELDQKYAAALARHDLPGAKSLFALRQRVWRAVLLKEEWQDWQVNAPAAAESANEPPVEVSELIRQQIG